MGQVVAQASYVPFLAARYAAIRALRRDECALSSLLSAVTNRISGLEESADIDAEVCGWCCGVDEGLFWESNSEAVRDNSLSL